MYIFSSISDNYRTIKFEKVLTNVGSSYSPETGIFTSCNGTFLIGFGGVSYGSADVLLHLQKNGKRIISAFGNSGCSNEKDDRNCQGSAHNTVILKLEDGDKINVELAKGHSLHNAHYHNYAVFYGIIL